MVPQFLNEAVMRERLTKLGHQTAFGRELVGFEQDAERVTAQIGDEVVRARYLVGTDGGRSLVQHVLGIDFRGETLGIGALVADVALDGINRDAWHRFGAGPRQVSLSPLAGTKLFQIQGSAPLEGDVDLSAAGLAALVAERTGLKIMIHSVAWASVYSMNARLADRYRVGRVFLAGDAAHTHPPTGAQGLNTSVQDSYNLGWKLGAVLRARQKNCYRRTKRKDVRSPPACSGWQHGYWMRSNKARGCGVPATHASWTLGTPGRR
jgi:2-polyprenyl-6-methoxyphenol hydroxylase-like FAD-dependent oxidoreductase